MKLSVRELVVFSLLGTLMYVSEVLMRFLPNVHLLAMFVVTFTVVYRKKALYPIYIYIIIGGIVAGFNIWWIPYLYIWTVLWGAAMLLPKKMPPAAAVPVYMVVCSLHGFLFGVLYAPAQALFFGLDREQTLAWIAAGAVFDVIHGISNFCAGALVFPLAGVLRKAERFS